MWQDFIVLGHACVLRGGWVYVHEVETGKHVCAYPRDVAEAWAALGGVIAMAAAIKDRCKDWHPGTLKSYEMLRQLRGDPVYLPPVTGTMLPMKRNGE